MRFNCVYCLVKLTVFVCNSLFVVVTPVGIGKEKNTSRDGMELEGVQS
jgi:hypothetical protein